MSPRELLIKYQEVGDNLTERVARHDMDQDTVDLYVHAATKALLRGHQITGNEILRAFEPYLNRLKVIEEIERFRTFLEGQEDHMTSHVAHSFNIQATAMMHSIRARLVAALVMNAEEKQLIEETDLVDQIMLDIQPSDLPVRSFIQQNSNREDL